MTKADKIKICREFMQGEGIFELAHQYNCSKHSFVLQTQEAFDILRWGLLHLKKVKTLTKDIINTRPITPKEEWISVYMGLPNYRDRVDALHKHKKGFLENIFINTIEKISLWEDSFGNKYDFKDITHWRPSPPTKDQTEKECDNPDCRNGRIPWGSMSEGESTDTSGPEATVACPDCKKDQTEKECNACCGSGFLLLSSPSEAKTTCTDCDGTGKVIQEERRGE